MSVFSKPSGIYEDISDKYKRPREAVVISNPIEVQGKKYREIVYNKTFLGKDTNKPQGFLYITEDGSVVTDIKIQKLISEIAFYSRLIFDESGSGNIKSAIVPEGKIKREEEENRVVIEGLEALKVEGASGIVIIIHILSKLPEVKIENNTALLEFIEKLDKHNSEDMILSRALIDELLPYYRSTLIKNFERIKLVNKGKKYYDNISYQVTKKKNQLKTRFANKQGRQMLTMIENKMAYLKKILEVYDAIAGMSEAEYIKYLNKMDEMNINKNLEMVRV